MLVLPVDGPAALIVPRLERAPALGSPAGEAGLVDVVSWDETDDPIERVAASLPAGADLGAPPALRSPLGDAHPGAAGALRRRDLRARRRGTRRAACRQGRR